MLERARPPARGRAARPAAPPLVLTGPGLEIFGAFIQGLLRPGIALAPPERRFPRAATLARLAQAAWRRA